MEVREGGASYEKEWGWRGRAAWASCESQRWQKNGCVGVQPQAACGSALAPLACLPAGVLRSGALCGNAHAVERRVGRTAAKAVSRPQRRRGRLRRAHSIGRSAGARSSGVEHVA